MVCRWSIWQLCASVSHAAAAIDATTADDDANDAMHNPMQKLAASFNESSTNPIFAIANPRAFATAQLRMYLPHSHQQP